MKEQRRLARRVLDRPAVGTGAVRQAAVSIPAAAPPAGREHLPVDGVLISAALRHAPSQHAQLHLLQRRDGVARTFTLFGNVILFGCFCPLMAFVNVTFQTEKCRCKIRGNPHA